MYHFPGWLLGPQTLRQLWSSLYHPCRVVLTRIRFDDGLHFYQILSVLALSSSVQLNWCINDLLFIALGTTYVVLQQTCFGCWNSVGRIRGWRHNLSHHVSEISCLGWIRLGFTNLCFRYPRLTYLFEFIYQIKNSATPKGSQGHGFHKTASGGKFLQDVFYFDNPSVTANHYVAGSFRIIHDGTHTSAFSVNLSTDFIVGNVLVLLRSVEYTIIAVNSQLTSSQECSFLSHSLSLRQPRKAWAVLSFK